MTSGKGIGNHKPRHSHPAKKGEFIDGCTACEVILQGKDTFKFGRGRRMNCFNGEADATR